MAKDIHLVNPQQEAEGLTGGPLVSARQFYQHDPLLVLLKDKWGLRTLWILLGAMVLAGGAFLTWGLWIGHISASRGDFWVLGDTLSVLLQTFVIFPLLFLIYLRIPAALADLFNTLRTNGVIGEVRKDRPGVESYAHFVHSLVTWTDRSWWAAGAAVVVVLYVLVRILLIDPQLSSRLPYGLRVVTYVVYLPLMYATILSVIRLVLALGFTNWLFYLFQIRVKPLHADGSGGLGSLGRILWVSVALMLWDALLLSAALLSVGKNLFSPLEMILLGAVYVALIPSLLIGWLLLPHRMMVKARVEALQPLADQFQQALLVTQPSLNNDAKSIKDGTDRLSELKQRYDLVRDIFPTWPLEVHELRRVVAALSLPALLPLLLPLLPQLISLVSHLLSPAYK